MDKKKDQIFVLFFSEIGFYLSWLPWNTLFLRMTLNSFLIFLFLLCKCTTTIWILHLLNFFLIHPLFFFSVSFCSILDLLLCSSSWLRTHSVSYACFELRILLPQLSNAGIRVWVSTLFHCFLYCTFLIVHIF